MYGKTITFWWNTHILSKFFEKWAIFVNSYQKSGVRELKSEKRFASIHLSPVDARNPIFGQVGVLRGSKKSDAGIFEILRFSPHFGPKTVKNGDAGSNLAIFGSKWGENLKISKIPAPLFFQPLRTPTWPNIGFIASTGLKWIDGKRFSDLSSRTPDF